MNSVTQRPIIISFIYYGITSNGYLRAYTVHVSEFPGSQSAVWYIIVVHPFKLFTANTERETETRMNQIKIISRVSVHIKGYL